MRHSEIRRAEDPLLLAALEGFPHQLPHLPAIPTREAWIFNPGGFGGAYLTVVARAAFGCVRYPGFADRRLLRPSPLTIECFSRLRPEDLERSVAELRRLYEHTQMLLLSGETHGSALDPYREGDALRLQRGLRHDYGLRVARLRNQASASRQHTVVLRTDTLMSYTLTGGYTNGVSLRQAIPIVDILLSSATVALSGFPGQFRTVEDEWIVLNRDPRGEWAVPTMGIEVMPGYYGRTLEQMAAWPSKDEDSPVYVGGDRLPPNIELLDGPLVRLAKWLERLVFRPRTPPR